MHQWYTTTQVPRCSYLGSWKLPSRTPYSMDCQLIDGWQSTLVLIVVLVCVCYERREIEWYKDDVTGADYLPVDQTALLPASRHHTCALKVCTVLADRWKLVEHADDQACNTPASRCSAYPLTKSIEQVFGQISVLVGVNRAANDLMPWPRDGPELGTLAARAVQAIDTPSRHYSAPHKIDLFWALCELHNSHVRSLRRGAT